MAELDKKLENFDSLSFPAFTQEVRGKFRMHTLIKLKANTWPDATLINILRGLPPTFAINVDPDDLL